MKRQLWPGMASHYCRASDSIRLSGENITRAIHTHIGSVCLCVCLCVCMCVCAFVRQRQTEETHNLRLHRKAFIESAAFELGLWSYSELKWHVWSGSNDPALCVCVCVPARACMQAYETEAERKPRERSQTVLLYNCRQINTWPQHWRENPIRGQRLEVRLRRLQYTHARWHRDVQ